MDFGLPAPAGSPAAGPPPTRRLINQGAARARLRVTPILILPILLTLLPSSPASAAVTSRTGILFEDQDCSSPIKLGDQIRGDIEAGCRLVAALLWNEIFDPNALIPVTAVNDSNYPPGCSRRTSDNMVLANADLDTDRDLCTSTNICACTKECERGTYVNSTTPVKSCDACPKGWFGERDARTPDVSSGTKGAWVGS